MVRTGFLSHKKYWTTALVALVGYGLLMRPPSERTTLWLVGKVIRNSWISERKQGEYLQRYLRKGMSMEEVKLLLGDPLLADSFCSGPIGAELRPRTNYWYPQYGLSLCFGAAELLDD